MLTEIKTDRAERMEAHRQALIEAALEHEQVAAFLTRLSSLLDSLDRNDVETIVQTRLKPNGVGINILLGYDSLYPGQIQEDPTRATTARQAEKVLLEALRQNQIKLGSGLLIGDSHSMKSNYCVLRCVVDYQGNFHEDKS